MVYTTDKYKGSERYRSHEAIFTALGVSSQRPFERAYDEGYWDVVGKRLKQLTDDGNVLVGWEDSREVLGYIKGIVQGFVNSKQTKSEVIARYLYELHPLTMATPLDDELILNKIKLLGTTFNIKSSILPTLCAFDTPSGDAGGLRIIQTMRELYGTTVYKTDTWDLLTRVYTYQDWVLFIHDKQYSDIVLLFKLGQKDAYVNYIKHTIQRSSTQVLKDVYRNLVTEYKQSLQKDGVIFTQSDEVIVVRDRILVMSDITQKVYLDVTPSRVTKLDIDNINKLIK